MYMIVSKVANSSRIESLHPLLKTLFDYVNTHDLADYPTGRIDVDGDNLYINHVYAEAVPAGKQVLETHRDYIDVHILMEGREKIGWKPAEELQDEVQPYVAEADCALFADAPLLWADLTPGLFLVAYPEDAHAPLVGEGKIRKLIGKIKIS